MYKIIRTIFVVSVGIVALDSCKPKQFISAPPSSEEAVAQLIFFNFSIVRDTTGTLIVNLKDQIIAEGKLKYVEPEDFFLTGGLLCVQLNKALEPINQIFIENPLARRVEYLNDSGGFESRVLQLDSAEFSVRMQLFSEAEFIIIEQADAPGAQLLKHKL